MSHLSDGRTARAMSPEPVIRGEVVSSASTIGICSRPRATIRIVKGVPMKRLTLSAVAVAVVAALAIPLRARQAKPVEPAGRQGASVEIDALLQAAVEQKRVPMVVAMVADGKGIVYEGAHGANKDAI